MFLAHRQSIPDCDKGAMLLEVLVASFLGAIVIMLTVATTIVNQQLFQTDMARMRLNQNLRSAMDLMGIEIRQAGERLPDNFPAIEIIDGVDGAPDEIILRRHLIDEVVTLCQSITAGQSHSSIVMSNVDPAAAPACVYGGQSVSLGAFQNYREDNDSSVQLFIYNPNTGNGEFIQHIGEIDTGGTLALEITAKSFEHSYTAEVSAVYIIQERRFILELDPDPSGIIRLIENGDTDNPQSVMFGIQNLQLSIEMSDGSQLSAFSAGDLWSQIAAIEITVTGSERGKKTTITNTLTSRFYPRNVLSL